MAKSTEKDEGDAEARELRKPEERQGEARTPADQATGGDREGEEDVEGSDGSDGEEEETCGFCIFMKGGGCKEAFEAWSKCVDSERGKDDTDFTETCRDATIALRECMLAHKDYYQPLLDEEEREMEARSEADAPDRQSESA